MFFNWKHIYGEVWDACFAILNADPTLVIDEEKKLQPDQPQILK